MPTYMKTLFKISITIATIILTMPLVRAEVDPGTHILREATPQMLETMIKIFDPKFKKMEDGKGYVFKFEGNTVVVFRTGTRIRLGAAFTGKKVALTRVNEWNKTQGPARAYLVDDGAAVALANEIELKDGVTIGTVSWFMSNFVMDIPNFISFMKE